MNGANLFAFIAIVIFLGFSHLIAYSAGYDKAVSKQKKADQKVEDTVEESIPEVIKVDEEYKEGKDDIRKDTELKYTQLEAEQQYNYGVAEGRRREREEARKKGFSEEHNCLAIPYSDDSGMLKSAKGLQQDISGVSKNPE